MTSDPITIPTSQLSLSVAIKDAVT